MIGKELEMFELLFEWWTKEKEADRAVTDNYGWDFAIIAYFSKIIIIMVTYEMLVVRTNTFWEYGCL